MKSLSPALQAHLDEGTTTLAWCWRITRADGVTFGFTDHDRTLSFEGTEFEPESGLTASEVRSGSDLSVDAQDAQGVLSSDRITETDILDGRWDNASVEVWRVNWSAPAQRVLLRRGAIGQIRRGRLAFVAEVRSLAHLLGQTVGRTFQASCDAALGDVRCGVNLGSPAFKGTGAVIDVFRDRAFTATGLTSFAAGWFAFGLVEWSSGANAGRRVEVLSHDLVDGVAILTLLEAPVRPITATDAFVIRAGCDNPAPAGARVVVLNTTLASLPIAEADLGLPWNWRVGPAARAVSDASYAALGFTPTGRGLVPFAPVHVEQPWRAARNPGDLTIRWTRRSRALVADAWEQVEVPLTEDLQSYDVQILDGTTVKRTLTSSTTSVLYTATQQTADWGAPLGPGQTLAIRIFQLSNRLGRGTPATVILQF